MRDSWAGALGVVVIGGFVAGTVGTVDAAGTRIGYLDAQKVLVRSVAGIAAREQLEREQATMQKDLDARKAEVDKLREELDKKALVLSAEARREKEEVFQRKVRDIRRVAEDLEKELRKKEQQLRNKMGQELWAVVERFGKERGYLLILEKTGGSVIYGDPEADVTEEIIKLYDQEKKK